MPFPKECERDVGNFGCNFYLMANKLQMKGNVETNKCGQTADHQNNANKIKNTFHAVLLRRRIINQSFFTVYIPDIQNKYAFSVK